MNDLVAAGYVGVRPQPRPEWPGLSTLPASIISITAELNPIAPVVSWLGGVEDQLQRFGVDDVPRALDWLRAHDEELGFPDVSPSPSFVREFVQRFAPGARIVGYGLRAGEVDAFLAEQRERFGQRDGIVETLERRAPFETGGTLLGFEPCGVNTGGITTSWHVHGFADGVTAATGVRVNRDGLVPVTGVDVVDAYVRARDDKEPDIWRS